MDNIGFWHEHIGRHLAPPGATPSQSGAVEVAQRTANGVQFRRVGSTDVFYIAKPGASILISKLEPVESITTVPSEQVSARKYLASWLIQKAAAPFLVGVIGKANPNQSFRVSLALTRAHFCETGGGFSFDLLRVRRAAELFSGFDWKAEIAPLIYRYESVLFANEQEKATEYEKLKKHVAKNPDTAKAVRAADIKPRSGEYKLLSWFNISREGESA